MNKYSRIKKKKKLGDSGVGFPLRCVNIPKSSKSVYISRVIHAARKSRFPSRSKYRDKYFYAGKKKYRDARSSETCNKMHATSRRAFNFDPLDPISNYAGLLIKPSR